jgi:uncharacterized membrane protein affecting hemolysin expression
MKKINLNFYGEKELIRLVNNRKSLSALYKKAVQEKDLTALLQQLGKEYFFNTAQIWHVDQQFLKDINSLK